MIPGNRVFRRRKDRPSQTSPSICSRIVGFFRPLFSCFKNTNIVSPINENDSNIFQTYSGSSIKAINGSLVAKISIGSSCGEHFGEERRIQSNSNEAETCSKYPAEVFDTEEEFRHPCIPQDNATTGPNYARLADSCIGNDDVHDDVYRGNDAESPIQCRFSLEHPANPSIRSEDFGEESMKKKKSPEKPREPKNKDRMVLDGSMGNLSIDEMVHDLMQLPTSLNDSFGKKTEAACDQTVSRLDSQSSPGICCSFNSKSNMNEQNASIESSANRNAAALSTGSFKTIESGCGASFAVGIEENFDENDEVCGPAEELMTPTASQQQQDTTSKTNDSSTGGDSVGIHKEDISASNRVAIYDNIGADALKSCDCAQEEASRSDTESVEPNSPAGICKAKSYLSLPESSGTNAIQLQDNHIFLQGKNHQRLVLQFADDKKPDFYDPMLDEFAEDIFGYANEIEDQISRDYRLDIEMFLRQYQESSRLCTIFEEDELIEMEEMDNDDTKINLSDINKKSESLE